MAWSMASGLAGKLTCCRRFGQRAIAGNSEHGPASGSPKEGASVARGSTVGGSVVDHGQDKPADETPRGRDSQAAGQESPSPQQLEGRARPETERKRDSKDTEAAPFSLDEPWRPALPLVRVPREGLAGRVLRAAPEEMRSTLARVIEIATTARGACSFAVAPKAAYRRLTKAGKADFLATDCCERWDRGYMTMRTRGTSVHEQAFVDAVHECSERTPDRCWPPGHEAEGLSKDSFTALLDVDGRCLKSSVTIMGLPCTPFRWDDVSCMHGDGLGLLWLLRRLPAAVVLRCAGGVVHVILPCKGVVVAFGTPEPWLVRK